MSRGAPPRWASRRGVRASPSGTPRWSTVLREAGAVILGRTNLSQTMLFVEARNPIFGQTSNPWSAAHTPGGSSGGEGAAIASGMSPLGLGTDIGGSIRTPAHFSGIAGLKPTLDRLPMRGYQSVLAGQEAVRGMGGPLARTVGDLALFFRSARARASRGARSARGARGLAITGHRRGREPARRRLRRRWRAHPVHGRDARADARGRRAPGSRLRPAALPAAGRAPDALGVPRRAERRRRCGARGGPLRWRGRSRARAAAAHRGRSRGGAPSRGARGGRVSPAEPVSDARGEGREVRGRALGADRQAAGLPDDAGRRDGDAEGQSTSCSRRRAPRRLLPHGESKNFTLASSYAMVFNATQHPAGVVPVTRVRPHTRPTTAPPEARLARAPGRQGGRAERRAPGRRPGRGPRLAGTTSQVLAVMQAIESDVAGDDEFPGRRGGDLLVEALASAAGTT